MRRLSARFRSIAIQACLRHAVRFLPVGCTQRPWAGGGVRDTETSLSRAVLGANGGKPLKGREIYCRQSWHIFAMRYDILEGRGVKKQGFGVRRSLCVRRVPTLFAEKKARTRVGHPLRWDSGVGSKIVSPTPSARPILREKGGFWTTLNDGAHPVVQNACQAPSGRENVLSL